MGVFRIVERDVGLHELPALAPLADTLRTIRETCRAQRSEGIEERLAGILNRLRERVRSIDDARMRNLELLELLKAEISLGRLEIANQIFEALGHEGRKHLYQIAMLLYRDGYTDDALSLAVRTIADVESACQALLILAEIYDKRRGELIDSAVRVSKSISATNNP